MTMQEFYSRVGGSYEEMLRRLGNEARVKKFLGMLSRDGSMQTLRTALEQEDYETAFRAAHTLKGVALNLGLTRLAEVDNELTETLRPRMPSDSIVPQLAQVEQCYAEAMSALSELEESSQ